MYIPRLKNSFLALGILLTGCTSSVNCDVVTYNEMGAPRGEAIQVVHMNSALNNSAEFLNYSSQIKEKLGEIGYYIKRDTSPDLIFTIDYGITEGKMKKEEIDNCPLHYHYNENNESDPDFFGQDCEEHENWNISSYNHYLDVSIRNNGNPLLIENPIFEGQVFSRSSLKQMPKLMPYLIKALFMDFPGENFTVKSIVLEEDKGHK